MTGHDTFFTTLTNAINDFIDHGFDSQERFEKWMDAIRKAAASSMTPDHVAQNALRGAFQTIYRRLIDRGQILKMHEGVGLFTLQKLAPALHMELDRAIRANASLIKLNKVNATEKTMQRFAGWATSVPAGGTRAEDKVKVKTEIRKALAQLPFQERRVAIDQGAKFASSLNRIVATGGGAIAARWRSHKNQAGYDGRPDHNAIDGHVFLIRGSWADEKGLVKPGPDGYTDETEQPGEKVFCKCHYVYLYSPSQLPDDMMTEKGRAELAKARAS